MIEQPLEANSNEIPLPMFLVAPVMIPVLPLREIDVISMIIPLHKGVQERLCTSRKKVLRLWLKLLPKSLATRWPMLDLSKLSCI